MLLERLNGRSPAKVVGAKNFHDIGYLRDLLFNVFTALDVGQRRVGAAPAALRRPGPPRRPGRGGAGLALDRTRRAGPCVCERQRGGLSCPPLGCAR